jgi:hypothetical protein
MVSRISNVIASRHHQIRRPGDPPAQLFQNRCRGFGDPVAMFASRRRVGKARSDPIAAVRNARGNKARPSECVKDAQQARLGNTGKSIKFVQRRIRLHLQGLEHAKAPLQHVDFAGVLGASGLIVQTVEAPLHEESDL